MGLTPIKAGEILECVLALRDDSGLCVKIGDSTGVVSDVSIAWRPEDVPAVGDRVKVVVRFLTPESEVPFDFVGSIKDAYPERHPINFIDNSIIGSRFRSVTRPAGQWIQFGHPTGIPALLPREKWKCRGIGYEDEVEAEVVGIDRERGRLLVRLPTSDKE